MTTNFSVSKRAYNICLNLTVMTLPIWEGEIEARQARQGVRQNYCSV